MEIAKNKTPYSPEAIQDILERIDRINDLILMHMDREDGANSLNLKSWRKMKKQLTMQFIALLNDPNLVITVKPKAA